MMAVQILLILLLCARHMVFAFPVPQPSTTDNIPTVNLGYATYQGVALDDGVNQFLGMRYAAPPTGNLRWRAPEDPVHES